jgi:hypothetical protein
MGGVENSGGKGNKRKNRGDKSAGKIQGKGREADTPESV